MRFFKWMLKNQNFLAAFILFLFLSGASLKAYGPSQEMIPKLSKEDSIRIGEVFHLWQKKGDIVWPGWTSEIIPINYIKQNFEYLVGHPNPPEEYVLQGKNSVLHQNVFVRPREMRETLATTVYMNGIDTVAIGSPDALDYSTTHWVFVVLHEMFHVYQAIRGSVQKTASLGLAYGDDASWQLNYPFPYKDQTIKNSIHIIGNFLFVASTTQNDFETYYDSLLLIEATNVFKELIRIKYGDLKNYKYAEFQTWKEGIAKYTEYKMAELAASDDYNPLPSFKDSQDYMPYQIIWEEYYRAQFNPVRSCGSGVEGRMIFYYLGLGKGVLLDRVFPKWKDVYFEESIWLDDIFYKNLDEIKARMIESIKKLEKKDLVFFVVNDQQSI